MQSINTVASFSNRMKTKTKYRKEFPFCLTTIRKKPWLEMFGSFIGQTQGSSYAERWGVGRTLSFPPDTQVNFESKYPAPQSQKLQNQ